MVISCRSFGTTYRSNLQGSRIQNKGVVLIEYEPTLIWFYNCPQAVVGSYALHAQPISFFSILSPAQYWVSSTNHLTPWYAISSIPPLHRPSLVQVFSSTQSSQTLLASFPPAMSTTKFHTHPRNVQNAKIVYGLFQTGFCPSGRRQCVGSLSWDMGVS